MLRVEAHEIARAAPEVALVGEEIVDLVGLAFEPAKVLDRHVDEGVLRVPGIERDDDEDDVVPRLGHLDVEEHEVVVRAC